MHSYQEFSGPLRVFKFVRLLPDGKMSSVYRSPFLQYYGLGKANETETRNPMFCLAPIGVHNNTVDFVSLMSLTLSNFNEFEFNYDSDKKIEQRIYENLRILECEADGGIMFFGRCHDISEFDYKHLSARMGKHLIALTHPGLVLSNKITPKRVVDVPFRLIKNVINNMIPLFPTLDSNNRGVLLPDMGSVFN